MGEKTVRQLSMYNDIISTHFHGPSDLMKWYGISRRTLQRDLKDLKDSGIISLKYIKAEGEEGENYVRSEEEPVFDETATGRRRQHLIRLNRLAILIDRLPRTDMHMIHEYESELETYEYLIEDPGDLTPEEIGDKPDPPELQDVKAVYYSLFPDSNERTRQRDFEILNDIGLSVYYSRKYKMFIFEEDDPYYYYG
ncbi:MAG: hypothetical protein K6F86_03890 [Lachnospiraceae bacterium]|nr:hypothetical protein [Lachnospiraceae bacterium]